MVFISFPAATGEDIYDENSYLLRNFPHFFEQQDFALQTFFYTRPIFCFIDSLQEMDPSSAH